MSKYKMKSLHQNFDLNLYHLFMTLEDMQKYNFSEKIKTKVNELYSLVDTELFPKIPNNYEIIDTKCIYILFLEKSNLIKN